MQVVNIFICKFDNVQSYNLCNSNICMLCNLCNFWNNNNNKKTGNQKALQR